MSTPYERVQQIYENNRDNFDFTIELARRLERQERSKNGKVLPIYVVAEGISRACGGPEEGGWWYDVTEILEVRKCWDWKTAKQHAKELKELYPPPRYSRGSVLGGQDIYIDFVSDPSFFPEEGPFGRPRYE